MSHPSSSKGNLMSSENIIPQETNSKKKVANVAAEKNPLIILGLSMVAFALVGGIIYVIKK